ncbi:hypothetical protein EON66_04700 [archaeon]|nr:MAG: hypothetical protein EON66_04700 [archaeon]
MLYLLLAGRTTGADFGQGGGTRLALLLVLPVLAMPFFANHASRFTSSAEHRRIFLGREEKPGRSDESGASLFV